MAKVIYSNLTKVGSVEGAQPDRRTKQRARAIARATGRKVSRLGECRYEVADSYRHDLKVVWCDNLEMKEAPGPVSFFVQYIRYENGWFDRQGGAMRVTMSVGGKEYRVLEHYVSSSCAGEAPKWAHSWGTDFSRCPEEEDVESFLRTHADTLWVAAQIGICFGNFYDLQDEVLAFES